MAMITGCLCWPLHCMKSVLELTVDTLGTVRAIFVSCHSQTIVLVDAEWMHLLSHVCTTVKTDLLQKAYVAL